MNISYDNSELFELQKKLCEKRLINSAYDKSPQWSENDIISVLCSLKNGKCRDPLGLINEVFKPPVAGTDLIKSITIMMNRIKDSIQIPETFRFNNISTIYKNKGSRSNLENDRGIFTSTVPDMILQKLIPMTSMMILIATCLIAMLVPGRGKILEITVL